MTYQTKKKNFINALNNNMNLVEDSANSVGFIDVATMREAYIQIFYRIFESKETVISRHLKTRLDNWWIEAIQKPDFNLVEAVFSHYWEHRELCILLYKQGLAHLSLQSVKEACGPKPEQPNVVAYTAAYFSYGLYGWIEEWFKRGMQETPEEMAGLWEKAQRETNKAGA